MTRIGVEATFQIHIRGPLLVNSSQIGPWGIDSVALRDPDGHLVIPGGQVQGRVREILDQLGADFEGNARPVNRELRLESPAHRYQLQFSDFRSLRAGRKAGEQTVTQIKMDAESGAASTGMMRILDCPLLPGEIATFVGKVRFFEETQEGLQRTLTKIQSAIDWISAFGANKSVGFGASVAEPEADAAVDRLRASCCLTSVTNFDKLSLATRTADGVDFIVDFSFQDLLCLPKGVINGNLLESGYEIPGEVLKGAVAMLLKNILHSDPYKDLPTDDSAQPYQQLCKWFHRIRITTARAHDNLGSVGLPEVLPLSLGFVEQEVAEKAESRLVDFALIDPAEEERLATSCAATFAADWKGDQWKQVESMFQVVRPDSELRVRTAIDSAKRRALDEMLFGQRSLRPENVSWRAMISIDDRTVGSETPTPDECNAAIAQLLSLLETGWLSVSTTKARGGGKLVATRPQPSVVEPLPLGDAECFVITLRAPAWMVDPDPYFGDQDIPSMVQIDQLYSKFWDEISDGSLRELPSRRFKRDRLVGGYQAWKYRRSEGGKRSAYRPVLLTDVGSVFVLQVVPGKKEAARSRIGEWLRCGLPLPKWVIEAYGISHSSNIFLPQNGYGEITVNHRCHQGHSFSRPVKEVLR